MFNTLIRSENSDLCMNNGDMESERIIVFAPWCYGHHPSYIQHLIEYWCEHKLSGNLNIVVSLEFMRSHSDVVALASHCDRNSVNFVTMTSQEQAELESKSSGIARALGQYQLICKYAVLLKATRGLIVYFDSCQLPLVLGAKLPCPFSGIYFRPTFHYNNFANYLPTGKERLQQWREKFFLYRILKHPQLKTLFCLDPFVVKPILQFRSKVRAIHLPDPVQIRNCTELKISELRDNLGIQPGRKVFFLFGRLDDARKGVPQLLEAITLLSPTLCQKVCLLIVGVANLEEKAKIESSLFSIRQSHSVQIVSNFGYLPETEVQPYFHLADVVLAPYQRHVGMSGILLLAAAAQKPVLSSNYGLMGEIVKRYELGLTVDSTDKSEIAKGLTRFLVESPEALGDQTKMKAFVEENSAERFAKEIFSNI